MVADGLDDCRNLIEQRRIIVERQSLQARVDALARGHADQCGHDVTMVRTELQSNLRASAPCAKAVIHNLLACLPTI